MRNRMLYLLIAIFAFWGVATVDAEESKMFKAVVERAETDSGEVIALRVKLEGGGHGTCGNVPEGTTFKKVGEVAGNAEVPIYVSEPSLDCSVSITDRGNGKLFIDVQKPAAPNPFR